jgi:rhodanese-related sulfurtransferase
MASTQDMHVGGSAEMPPLEDGSGDEDCASGGLCPREVAHLMDFGRATVVDIREPEAFAARHIAGSIRMPAREFGPADPLVGGTARIILCCDTGQGSRREAARLRALGRGEVGYLAGGLDAWAAENLGLAGRSR